MAVEALKAIREGEEEGRKLIEEANGSAAEILKGADDAVKQLKEKAHAEENDLEAQISDKYTKEGKKEEEAIMRDALAEAEKQKTTAESEFRSTVNLVLVRILGLR
jgi:vacuolar-type H+-ATPase subunit H